MATGRSGDRVGARRRSAGQRRPRRWLLALSVGVLAIAAVAVVVTGGLPSRSGEDPDRAAAVDDRRSGSFSGRRASPEPTGQCETPRRFPSLVAGFPDECTTGVPDGAPLTDSGTVTVTEDGAVVENLSIVDGYIDVQAHDVTIRNVRITTDREFLQWAVVQQEGYGGLVLEDSEIFGNDVHQLASGVSNHGGMITVRRVEIHSVTDGIISSHGLIEDNYLHSPTLFEGDHTDMIQTVGGSQAGLPLRIRHNTVINTEPQTAAVFLDDSTGHGLVPVRDVVIEGNLLAGGGYTVYGGGLRAEGHHPENIVIRDNVFSRELWPDSGYYGPVAYFDVHAPGCAWEANVWDDGRPVDADQA